MVLRKLAYKAIIILSFCSACEPNGKPDPRLTAIDFSIEENPGNAIEVLDTFDRTDLTENDRIYLDLLTIKAHDKAYILHTTDSLIQRGIDYLSVHPDNPLYPQAIYYAGRVYSDMGDYPTALRYFHNSLDYIDSHCDNNVRLKGNVLSQTGRLLNTLRLYEESIPYIMESMDINKILDDSISEVYDTQLLGAICLRSGKYEEAIRHFRKALEKSKYMPEHHKAKSYMYLAEAYHQTGKMDSALSFIADAPEKVSKSARNNALAYGAKIYLDAGMTDSAYKYASRLISSDKDINKTIGYEVLLSPSVRVLVPQDSIDRYLNSYVAMLESYLDDNENLLSIIQQSYHNYDLHLRERDKAEMNNDRLHRRLILITVALIIMILIILILQNIRKKEIIRLHEALDKVDNLERRLNYKHNVEINNDKQDVTISPIPYTPQSAADLRNKLRNRLYELYLGNKDVQISPVILQSDTFRMLQDYIEKKKEIKPEDKLWKEIKSLVMSCSPDFIENLRLLVNGKLTSYDVSTSLLIKCGVTPTEMTVLLNRTKGTIVSRRDPYA